MDKANIKKHFVFNNRAADLYPLLVSMTNFLHDAVFLDDAASQKLKFILTELLTNAIKHSHCLESFIYISVNNREVLIEKSDLGDAFVLDVDDVKTEWPLPGRHIEKRSVEIYGDDNYRLMAKIENNRRISFFIEEQFDLSAQLGDILKLSEHFGLMIIARACDDFVYEFNVDSCSNNFIARVTV